MKLIFLIAGIFLFSLGFAQHPGNIPSDGNLSGIVLEKETNQAVEYANIVLYSKRDSSIVTGGITDRNGYFNIDNIRYGKYYVEIHFIGYGKHTIPDLSISPNRKQVNLGKIYLTVDAHILNEVSVEAQVNQVEYKLDKKVVNVNQDILSAGATAVEALENVPSIETDIEGNVSLRGSGSFMVLIDGRPSPLEGSEALQQIPASSIENIEIITNPSAKYDADGVSGIINVILKKDKRAGWNGQISANYGSFNTHGGDALINIRTNKLNFFVGGEYSKRIFRSEGSVDQISFIDDTKDFYLNTLSENSRIRGSGSARTGLDYYITEKDIVTISGKYGYGSWGSTAISKTENGLGKNDVIFNPEYYVSDGESQSVYQHFAGDLNYMKKFNNNGHELQIYTNYSATQDKSLDYYSTYDTDSIYNNIGKPENEYRTKEDGSGNMFLAIADYVYPITEKAKLEAGYQLRTSKTTNDYRYQTMQSEWIDDPTQHNPYVSTMNVQSGYVIFSNYFKTLGYQLGLRTEYTDRVFLQTLTNQEWTNADQNKFDFFPSVHLSYQFPADFQILASYSRRLGRPRPWFLNPFIEVVDPNTVRVGNPYLKNEYINSFDLSFQKKFGAHYVAIEAYYRETVDKINRVNRIDSNNPDIFISTFDNIGKDISTGAELMTNLNVTKWYNLNISGTGYYYEIIAGSNNYNSNNSIQWNARINNTIKIKKTGTGIQLGAFLNGPRLSAQGKSSASWAAGGGVRQDFLDRQLSVSLNLRNIFRTMKMERISETDSFSQHFLRQPRGPIVTLSVTYKINDFKSRREKGFTNEEPGRGGGDDEGM